MAFCLMSCDFAQLAHRLIIIEKRLAPREIASGMGLTYDTLYARLNQRVPFRP
jgi:hypothetical protein